MWYTISPHNFKYKVAPSNIIHVKTCMITGVYKNENKKEIH